VPDAEASIANNPQYEKGYLRLAFAKEVLQSYKDAYTAYLRVHSPSFRPLKYQARKMSSSIRSLLIVKDKTINT